MSNHYDPSEMMTLIGFSCKRSNALRREVLIDQDSFRGEWRFEHRNNLLLIDICLPELIEYCVLVAWRRGHTRSHSEHGS